MKIMTLTLLAACLAAAPVAGASDRQQGGTAQGEPRGRAVSGCNHQANEAGVKGKERQDFVERCMARGGDQLRARDVNRSCRERAGRQGLKGAAREEFISRCRGYRDDVRDEAGFAGRLRDCTNAAGRAGGTREQRRQRVESCMNQSAQPAPATSQRKDAEKRNPDRSILDEDSNRGKRRPGDDGTVKNKD